MFDCHGFLFSSFQANIYIRTDHGKQKKKYENCKKTKATKNKQNSNSINIPCKVAHTHTIPYCKWNERKEKKYTAETISVRSVKTQNIVVDICLFGRLSDSHRHCATKKPTQRKKKQHTHTHTDKQESSKTKPQRKRYNIKVLSMLGNRRREPNQTKKKNKNEESKITIVQARYTVLHIWSSVIRKEIAQNWFYC